jgi:hypothetical protein
MQLQDEGTVGWDPMYEFRPPWETRLFLLYSLVVLVFAAARTISLARQLGWFPLGRWERRRLGSQGAHADLLASAALRDKFPPLLTNNTFTAIVAGFQDPTGPAHLLQNAEARFQYLWDMCFATARSMRKVAVVTFLFSSFVLFAGLANDFRRASEQKLAVGSLGIFTGAISVSLVAFAFGIFVCAALYAAYSFWEIALLRRRAAWNYFGANIKNRSAEMERENARAGD